VEGVFVYGRENALCGLAGHYLQGSTRPPCAAVCRSRLPRPLSSPRPAVKPTTAALAPSTYKYAPLTLHAPSYVMSTKRFMIPKMREFERLEEIKRLAL
jgi:hypothetical protein